MRNSCTRLELRTEARQSDGFQSATGSSLSECPEKYQARSSLSTVCARRAGQGQRYTEKPLCTPTTGLDSRKPNARTPWRSRGYLIQGMRQSNFFAELATTFLPLIHAAAVGAVQRAARLRHRAGLHSRDRGLGRGGGDCGGGDGAGEGQDNNKAANDGLHKWGSFWKLLNRGEPENLSGLASGSTLGCVTSEVYTKDLYIVKGYRDGYRGNVSRNRLQIWPIYARLRFTQGPRAGVLRHGFTKTIGPELARLYYLWGIGTERQKPRRPALFSRASATLVGGGRR